VRRTCGCRRGAAGRSARHVVPRAARSPPPRRRPQVCEESLAHAVRHNDHDRAFKPMMRPPALYQTIGRPAKPGRQPDLAGGSCTSPETLTLGKSKALGSLDFYAALGGRSISLGARVRLGSGKRFRRSVQATAIANELARFPAPITPALLMTISDSGEPRTNQSKHLRISRQTSRGQR
jgi:hypothetical protein